MPWGPQLSLCSGALRPQLLKPKRPGARGPQQEQPPRGEACAPQLRAAPAATAGESPHAATETQHGQK